jgi:hypothetical protein
MRNPVPVHPLAAPRWRPPSPSIKENAMAATVPQSYANHRRYVPPFHFVALSLLLLNLFYWIYALIRYRTGLQVDGLVLAVAVVLVAYYARVFALSVQDRVIRLEERLRLARLCPDLSSRLDELTGGQLIALRFASDAELPGLTRRVLDEKMTDREAIKKQIQSWRPDNLRA